MKLTTQNYFDQVKKVDFSKAPPALQKSNDLVKKVGTGSEPWANYHASEQIRSMINIYFEKMELFLAAHPKLQVAATKPAAAPKAAKPAKATKPAAAPKAAKPAKAPKPAKAAKVEIPEIEYFNAKGKLVKGRVDAEKLYYVQPGGDYVQGGDRRSPGYVKPPKAKKVKAPKAAATTPKAKLVRETITRTVKRPKIRKVASAVRVTEALGVMSVYSPYNGEYVSKARELGGKWNSLRSTWEFDARNRKMVEAVLTEIYGSVGGEVDAVSVTIKVLKSVTESKDGVDLFGRTLAFARGNKTGAKLGGGVVLVSGRVGSGGSMKNWYTEIDGGSVLIVHDIPLQMVAKEMEKQAKQSSPSYSFEIEEEQVIKSVRKLPAIKHPKGWKSKNAPAPALKAKALRTKKAKPVDTRDEVPHLSAEVKYVQPFLRLVGKRVTIEQVRALHRKLEKDITKRNVRIYSHHAELLTGIADTVASLYDKMTVPEKEIGVIEKLEFTSEDAAALVVKATALVGSQRVGTATTLLSAFINMQGTVPTEKAVANLQKKLENEYAEHPNGDFALQVGAADAVLRDWKPGQVVRITKQQLSGLNGLMALGCPDTPPGKACGCGPKKARR